MSNETAEDIFSFSDHKCIFLDWDPWRDTLRISPSSQGRKKNKKKKEKKV